MPLQTIARADLATQDVNAILERDGCLAITDLLTETELTTLRLELGKGFADAPLCRGNFFGFRTKRISSVFKVSPVAQRLALAPAVIAVMDHFLHKNCEQYQLNLTQGIQIHSGEPAQVIHTDDLMFPFELPVLGDQKMINCMWAVDTFTPENGGTLLVPGSHKWPRDRRPESHEIIAAAVPAGGVLIYFGSLLHGGGANTTNTPRTGLVLSYCLGWLRQAENHYLALPVELVKDLPPALQRLLGYFVHKPNLGAVHGRDPIELLQPGGLQGEFAEYIPEDVQALIAEYRRMELAKVA